MAEMDLEQSGLQEVANAMREENVMEEHVSNTAQKRKRDSESADDTRRPNNKRVSPNSGKALDQSKNSQDGSVEALQDYSNLHHGNPDNQNGSAEHASSTAAAALAGIYPTMTIPQPTDVSFATQGSDGDRGGESSFLDNSQQNDSFMENPTPTRASKPAVGSDEWHKVRKDNHKEGKS
jgi:transcriptional regulator CBF1